VSRAESSPRARSYDEVERDDRDRPARDVEPPDRDAPDREPPDEREPPDREDEPDEREDDALDRADDPLARDRDDEDAARVPRDREDDAAAGLRRSAAGTSSVTTAFVSCGISFSRKFAMRSSCLRYSRASFAVSASFSESASVSIAW
jgi:hypothetical protein